MQRSTFTDGRGATILRERGEARARGRRKSLAARGEDRGGGRKHGADIATVYAWRATWGGIDMPGTQRLKALGDEHARLKPLLADALPGGPEEPKSVR